ncbi:MAG: uncharacterized protein QG597_3425 [Actinomycetota bacterium]|nr:uncharacterized protein [Actinomycetota bacterium]
MQPTYTEYPDAASFLAAARETLEREECANSLMFGVCLRLVGEPEAYGSRPYLAAIESEGTLRAAAVMTPPYRLQLWTAGEPDPASLAMLTGALLQEMWAVPGVLAREAAALAFASAGHDATGAEWLVAERMRLYELRRVDHPAYPPGSLRPAGLDEIDLVRRWAYGFHEDCFADGEHERSMQSAEEKVRAGTLFVWVDGVPRSMAARLRPTPHGEAVSFVYTPPAQRGRGYATAAVAQLSQRVLDGGKEFCTLYADLANPVSNSIYQRIGYRPVADVLGLDFSAA